MTSFTCNRVGVVILATAAAGFLAAGGRAAAGPVVIVSQDGTVSAQIDPSHGESVLVDSKSFPAAGSFSRTATAQISITDFTAEASSSAEGQVGANGWITFDGALQYDARDTRPDDPETGIPTVKLDAVFHVTFTIDEPRDYDFQRTFTRGDTYQFNSLDHLQTLEGVDVPFVDIDANGGGTLLPGTYRLTVAETAEGLIGPGAMLDATYRIALDLTPNGGNNGGGGNPIPLPPAAWSSLVLFAAGAANRLRKGRSFAR
jgi:hypothetical protein